MSEAMTTAPARDWWRPDSWTEPVDESAAFDAGDSRLPYWALCGFTFILLLAPQTLVPGLVPALAMVRPALLAAAISVGTHLAVRTLAKRPLTVLTREMWLAGGLLVLAVATIPVSYWPGGSVSFLTGVFAKSLAVFWLLVNVLSTPARVRRFMVLLSLLGAPLAITGVANFLSGQFIEGATGVKRIAGFDAPLTHNPNDLALMLNLLLPIAVGLLFAGNCGRLLRLALVATIGLEIGAIVLTFSRAGFLALAMTTGVVLWKLRRRGKTGWAVLVVLVGLASLPFLPAGYGKRLSTMVNISADPTGSAQARWEDTVAALRYVHENPIVGAGIGQDILALNEERGLRWRSVHNVFLQLAVELGLPGLALFVALLGSCWKAISEAERASDEGEAVELAPLAAGVKMSLLAFVTAGLFHPAGYHFYFYYVAGLAVAIKVNVAAREARAAIAEEAR